MSTEASVSGHERTSLFKRIAEHWILSISATSVVAFFAVTIGSIQWRLWQNDKAKQRLLEVLSQRYPEVIFRGGSSYESSRVYINAVGVADPAARIEMKEWLTSQKAALYLTVQVRVAFFDDKYEKMLDDFEI